MRRWRWVPLTALSSLLIPLAAGTAAASGGGCYAPVTDGSGVTVAIRYICFTPTILHVQPGDVVTWVNRDGVPHTVSGAQGAWGDTTKLTKGETISVRFEREGVYPYFCYYHPSMVGAVVVGDGAGPGAAEERGITVRPVTVEPTSAPVIVAASPRPAAAVEPTETVGWWAAAGMALLAALSFAAALRARVRARRVELLLAPTDEEIAAISEREPTLR